MCMLATRLITEFCVVTIQYKTKIRSVLKQNKTPSAKKQNTSSGAKTDTRKPIFDYVEFVICISSILFLHGYVCNHILETKEKDLEEDQQYVGETN